MKLKNLQSIKVKIYIYIVHGDIGNKQSPNSKGIKTSKKQMNIQFNMR